MDPAASSSKWFHIRQIWISKYIIRNIFKKTFKIKSMYHSNFGHNLLQQSSLFKNIWALFIMFWYVNLRSEMMSILVFSNVSVTHKAMFIKCNDTLLILSRITYMWFESHSSSNWQCSICWKYKIPHKRFQNSNDILLYIDVIWKSMQVVIIVMIFRHIVVTQWKYTF